MLSFKRTLSTALFAASLACASAAMAHAHLQSQTPAADSSGPAPADLRLTFSEGVEANFTQVTVTEDGQPVTIKSLATDPADKKILIVTPTQPLKPGAYKVQWHAVSVDTHKSEGGYSFTIAQ
ncbi:copper homeostasis periplasmic binding protein CopC [Pseudomonas sp. HR96]|nr:copper homeostasis periplasmic binding protein CopC [Pseudomonas sp. HR96]WPP01903.1 copper homeostasis periplasmic binding protein CopC [Pseudomonas sp. HR96]